MKNEIRIKNGRIVGLGASGKESVSITALDELFGWFSAKEGSEFFNETAKGIGMIPLYFHEKETEGLDLFKDEILSMLPDRNGMYLLYEMSKFFNS